MPLSRFSNPGGQSVMGWVGKGLTEHPNSKWAKAHPAHLLTTSLITRTAFLKTNT